MKVNMMQGLKSFISTGTMIFFIALCVVSFIQMFAFFELTALGDFNLHSTVVAIFLSTLTIYLPYLFIPARWRWTIWILIAVFTLFMLTNVWYYRSFNSFYTGSVIRAGNIFNSFVVEGVFAVMCWSDLLIIAPPIALIFIYLRLKKDIKKCNYGKTFRIVMVLAWVLSPIAQAGLAFRRVAIYTNATTSNSSLRVAFHNFVRDCVVYPFNANEMPYNVGLLYTLCYTASSLIPKTADVSEQVELQFKAILESTSNHAPMYGNRGKNLIYIIAESLNSDVLRLPREYEITPTLHSLMSDSSIVALRVQPQVGGGGSSDGQFISNTGLYPIISYPFVSDYAVADYPSIAKALNYQNNFEMISEEKNVWNHYLTSNSYGFDMIYDMLESKPIGAEDERLDKEQLCVNVDGRIFRWASEIMRDKAQPFFAFVTSISAHTPYSIPSVTPMLMDNEYVRNQQDNYRNYLEAVHHFDDSLGKFIKQLKEDGLLENSVIVIVADHNAPPQHLSGELASHEIPLIIYNAGVKLNYEATIGQVDVFPTVLDVMGVEPYVLPQTGKEYRGLGRSIFGPNPPTCAIAPDGEIVPETSNNGSTLSERMELSSLMIRSRFFEK